MGEWISEVWHSREILYFLAWRDVKVRYKQAALGVAWAVVQPLLTMLISSDARLAMPGSRAASEASG